MTTFFIAFYILGVLAAFVIQLSCNIHTPEFKGYDCYFHLEDYDESEFEIEYHCPAKGMTLKWWHGESLVDICVDALCWQFTTKIQ